MAKKYERVEHVQHHRPSSIAEIKATFKVSCIKCDDYKNDERDWQGSVTGRGLHGSLSAFLVRVQHKHTLAMNYGPLIRLLTVCIDCCTKLALYPEDQVDQISRFRNNDERSGCMVLRISCKEIEELVSSKVIVMEGVIVNAGTIKTVGVDGKWRRWYLWNQ